MKNLRVLWMGILILALVALASSNSYAAAQWPEPQTEKPQQAQEESWRSKHLDTDPGFQQKMDQLSISSGLWSSLSRDEKLTAVDLCMQLYRARENSAVLNTPEFYVQRLDENFAQDPSMGTLPLPLALKVLAVMEYDYYNGQDKEELAKQILGDALYAQNKQRREQQGIR